MSNVLEGFLKDDYQKWGARDYLFEKKDGVNYTSMTFAQYVEKVNDLAAALNAKGLHGKNVGVYGPNSMEWMIADVSIMCYVGLSVGLPKDWSYDNLFYGMKKLEISCLIYDERMKENVDRLRKDFPDLTYISVQEDFDAWIEEGKRILKEYGADAADGLFTLPAKDDDEPSKVVFTSGSTSLPKAVLLSIRNVFSGWRSLERRVPMNESDVCYLFLPLNHTYGSIYNFIYSLVFGYQVYLTYSISDMAKEMMAVKPTVFSGVPVIYMRFYQAAQTMGIGLRALFGGRMKYLFCGGSKLEADVRNAYKAEGMYVMNAYALSETSSGFSIDYPGEEDVESVGTLFEDVDAIVLEPDEEGFGELAIKGENIFKGYYGDEKATREAFNEEGYFLTGDIGRIKSGKVYLRGRKDARLTLPNGEKVSIRRMKEKICSMHEGIVDARIYLQGNVLTADVFVTPSELVKDTALWEKTFEKLNAEVSRYERIGNYYVYGSEKRKGKLEL